MGQAKTDHDRTMTEPDLSQPSVRAALKRYWRSNLAIMYSLLAVWAVAGLGCGVLLADRLNTVRIGGFPLGFWFAQQGAIVVFVLLILVYALLMNRLDAKHHREITGARQNAAATPPPPGGESGQPEGPGS